MQLRKKIKIKLIYTNLTGLHIGGNKEDVRIGGIDSPVIKIKKDEREFAYVPGSSLKGKIRSLLEKEKGKINKKDGKGLPCDCGECEICKLFGPHDSKNIKENRRLIFRDSNYVEILDLIEEKMENTIDRLTGASSNIRKQERIIPGTIFEQEVIFDVYGQNDHTLFKTFLEGLKLLENDYLGGSGSRGYGRIKFLRIEIEDLSSNNKQEITLENVPYKDNLSLEEINELMEKESILNENNENGINKLVNEFENFIKNSSSTSDKNGNSNV